MILGGAKYTTSNNQGPSYVFEVRGAKKIFVGSFEDFFQNMAKGPVKFPKLKGGRSPWPHSPSNVGPGNNRSFENWFCISLGIVVVQLLINSFE